MIEVNGRRYAAPKQSTVVLCIDGCEPDYIAQAVASGHMPFMKQVLARGIAEAVARYFEADAAVGNL